MFQENNTLVSSILMLIQYVLTFLMSG